jgi:para-aminobenzoate synthetase/4-amino-4-deoxychorismate lyase
MSNELHLDVLSRTGTILLDTARPDAENQQSLLFTDPVDVLAAHTLDDVAPLLQQIDAAVEAGHHVAGFLSYEAGYAFEDFDPVASTDEPLAWFGVYDAPQHVALDAIGAADADGDASPSVADIAFSLDQADYLNAIDAIKAHIRAGNVYQINYTGRVGFTLEGNPWALYRALRRQQRVPYGAFLTLGDTQILSLSPELFFRREGSRVVTRPMKGTIHRGRTFAEDRQLQQWLAQDEKSRAENLMIVDLLRNDLSVCCVPGSVQVPALFTTEPYDTVTQMTSTVEGQLRPGVRYADLFRALFPCGSVTGAPKIRAMEIIRQLEEGPRGAYCGAIGYIAPNETAAFNVAIRTVVVRDGRGTMGVGSGIVWDSDAEAEFEECALKAQFLRRAMHSEDAEDFALIETMRWADGRIDLWDEHEERLRESATYFGFSFDADAMHRAVERHLAHTAPRQPHKVRLTLDRYGAFDATSSPISDPVAEPVQLIIADVRVDSSNPFRHHKTTRRAVYQRAYQQALKAGADEALLLNERGEVTEGARTNLFVETDGMVLTPPLASGVLNGVYRRHQLRARPDVREQVLYPDDLRSADRLFVCNAVRGWQEATLGRALAPPSVHDEAQGRG